MSEASLESAADRIFSRMKGTWNAADVQAHSKVYAEDASYVNRYGVLHLGRQEIAGIHAAAFASRFHNTKLRMAVQYFSLLAPRSGSRMLQRPRPPPVRGRKQSALR